MKNGKCPKCDSTEIAENISLPDYFDVVGGRANQAVLIARTPQNTFFKGIESFEVTVWICCGCGFMESYIDRPAAFGKCYRESNENNA